MKTLGTHNYYVYILTNRNKTVLYTGVTNNLKDRLYFHRNPNYKNSFTKKYNCFFLVYLEHFQKIQEAIKREKQIKGYSRTKKETLINNLNPEWHFFNDQFE